MGKNGIKALGVDLSDIANSLLYFGTIARRVFPYAMLDVSDISKTISILQRRGVRFVSLYARISPDVVYSFEQTDKSCETAFAILYDFVDGFLISGFGDIAKSVDPLLNLRLMNDEYREIIVAVPPQCTKQKMDDIIHYVLLSDIDGLLLDNEEQFDYFSARCKGHLKLFLNNVANSAEYDRFIDKGADAVFVKAKSKIPFRYVTKGIRIRFKSKR